MKRLNAEGFSHHFLLPVLVVLLIAAVGAYVITRPKAAVENGSIAFYFRGTSDGEKGHTIKGDGTAYTTFSPFVYYSDAYFNRTTDNRFVVHANTTSSYDGTKTYKDTQSTYTTCSGTTGFSYSRMGQTVSPIPNSIGLPVITYDWRKTNCSDGSPVSTTLYNVDADGKNKKILVADIPGSVSQLTWGPNGNRLYMARTGVVYSGTKDLLVRTGTGEIKTLATGIFDYSLSRDGKKILYSIPKASMENEYFVMNYDGTNKIKVAAAFGYLKNDSLNYDGTKFVYNTFTGTAAAQSLVVVNVDGSGSKTVATVTDGTFYDYSWSPTSNKVAYIMNDNAARKLKLITAYPDGSGKRALKTFDVTDPTGAFGSLDW